MKRSLAVLAVAVAIATSMVIAPAASAAPPVNERVCSALTVLEERARNPRIKFIFEALKQRLNCPGEIVVS